jgi:hypothetical protein
MTTSPLSGEFYEIPLTVVGGKDYKWQLEIVLKCWADGISKLNQLNN